MQGLKMRRKKILGKIPNNSEELSDNWLLQCYMEMSVIHGDSRLENRCLCQVHVEHGSNQGGEVISSEEALVRLNLSIEDNIIKLYPCRYFNFSMQNLKQKE